MFRDFHTPGRSTVMTCEGMAATSHPLASETAIATLRAGGTAADAAVAAVALLGIAEPHMTGIGGDCFCLVAKPGEPVWGYNGSGRSAAAAQPDVLIAEDVSAIGFNSVHAVTVPGAVEAWDAVLAAHGRFGLDHALAPAIRLAQRGVPIAPRVACDWGMLTKRLQLDPGAARHYLIDGRAPLPGEVMRFPALAATLETIAMRGPRAFYDEAAADIVATLAARGGWLTREDFVTHRGLTATPIATSYRGLEVVELPPNGQGVTALVLLDILENFDLGALDPHGAERLHLMLEAARLAYGVRDTYVADPRYVPIGMPALLDKGYAVRLGARIDRNACMALPPPVLPAGNTVYVTVVDRDRTAVSIINSLYSQFGCGIATEKTGIMLHNRGACFVIDPGHPNTYGPAKRPLSTLIPGLATRNGRCELSFGVMGAAYQAMGHAHVITNLVDYGMDLQAAIDEPRVFFQDDVTIVERGVLQATARGLEARGHRVETSLMPLGGGQAIAIDWQRGVLIGGSDPRKDGCALGY